MGLDDAESVLVEPGQEAGDRVQRVVGGDPVAEGLADHAADDLRDVGGVLRWAFAVEHLGARAVPPGRDGFLGEHDPDVGVVLDRLGRHPTDRAGPDEHRLVLAEHVHDRVRAQARPLLLDHVDHLRECVVGDLVGHLDDQDRDDLLFVLVSGVRVPPLVVVEDRRDGVAQQRRAERALLVGLVEADLVLDEPRRPHLVDVDLDRRVRRPVRGGAHRIEEPVDRGRDAPHDRRRRVRALLPVDEPVNDRGPVGGLAHAPVGFVEDQVQVGPVTVDGVGQDVPHRVLTRVHAALSEPGVLRQLLRVQQVHAARLELRVGEVVVEDRHLTRVQPVR